MYTLIELKPRAHTTDTLVLGISNFENPFEEIILSFWEEVYHINYCRYIQSSYPHASAMSMAKFDADMYAGRFHIIRAPYWKE